MTRRDMVLAALIATVWAVNFVVMDWGMAGRDGHAVPPLLFAAVRFTFVVVPAIFFVPKPAVPWRTIVGVGTFMSLGQFAFLYSALHLGMPPGLASLMLQAQVVLTVVLASGVLRERPTSAQVAGVGLGAVGLVVVATGEAGHIRLASILLCLAAALSWATGNVISRASRLSGGGLSLTVWSAVVVPVPLFGLSLLLDGPSGVREGFAVFGWHGALSTLYTSGLSSLVGYAVWNSLLSRNPSSAVVPWTLLVPPIGVAASWLLRGERPSGAEVIGGVVLIVGALVAQGVLRLRAPGLGVARAVAAGAGEGSADAAGGEVGGPLVDLVEGAERD